MAVTGQDSCNIIMQRGRTARQRMRGNGTLPCFPRRSTSKKKVGQLFAHGLWSIATEQSKHGCPVAGRSGSTDDVEAQKRLREGNPFEDREGRRIPFPKQDPEQMEEHHLQSATIRVQASVHPLQVQHRL